MVQIFVYSYVPAVCENENLNVRNPYLHYARQITCHSQCFPSLRSSGLLRNLLASALMISPLIVIEVNKAQ